MADQTHVNGRMKTRGAGTAVRRNVAGLLHDVITLAELQFQLLAIDVQETKDRSITSAVLLAVALVLALGTTPVLLMGIGHVIAERTDLTLGTALLITAAASLVLAVGVGLAGRRKLRSAVGVLSRSRRELAENINSIKHALKSPDPSSEADAVSPSRPAAL